MSTRGTYVLVKVLSVHRNYAFPCCIKCSRRIRTTDDENVLSCSECQQRYSKKDVSYRYRVNMTVSDRTQVASVTIFGQCLERFFGTSATHFKRFVDSLYLHHEELPVSVDQIVHECIEQCFVGSMVRLCFRGLPPCRTDSQVTRSSPTHLKNILTKIQHPDTSCLLKQGQKTSNLLASHISRPEDTERTATVFQFLKDYMEFFKCCSPKVVTPTACGFSIVTPALHSLDSQQLMSLQSKSIMSHKGFIRESSPQYLNAMVSPLTLSTETGSSTNQTPARSLPALSIGLVEQDSEFKSKTNLQNSPIHDGSQNRTALLLVSLLNREESEQSVCINGLNYSPNKSRESEEDVDISLPSTYYRHLIKKRELYRSLSDTSRDSICDKTMLKPENIGNDDISENKRTQSENSANCSDICKGKRENIYNENDDEMQRLQQCSENNDSQVMKSNAQADSTECSSSEHINVFLANMNLDSLKHRSTDMDKTSECHKGQVSSHQEEPCNDVFCGFQDKLGDGREFLREQTDQMHLPSSEDLDAFLVDLELSNFSSWQDCNSLQEPHLSVSRSPTETSSEELSSQKSITETFTDKHNDNQISLPSKEANCENTGEQYSLLEHSFYGDELSDSLLQEACAMNSCEKTNNVNKKAISFPSMNEKTEDTLHRGTCAVSSCFGRSVKKKERADCHDNDFSNENYCEKPERKTSNPRNTEEGKQQDWERFDCDSTSSKPCYSDKDRNPSAVQDRSKVSPTNDKHIGDLETGITDKIQNKNSMDSVSPELAEVVTLVSRSHGTPQLSLQSLLDSLTPVLFDDLEDSCYSAGSHCRLYRSLSLPEIIHPVVVMERGIDINGHSTPMNNDCLRKFEKLSGDLQSYSGLFHDDFKKQQIRSLPLETTAPFSGRAAGKDGFKYGERKMLGNKKDPNEGSLFSSFSERPVEDNSPTRNCSSRNGISVRSKTTPGEGQESDQICPDTPILFSFCSPGSNYCELTPDIQQDSLLSASLLECSYLK